MSEIEKRIAGRRSRLIVGFALIAIGIACAIYSERTHPFAGLLIGFGIGRIMSS